MTNTCDICGKVSDCIKKKIMNDLPIWDFWYPGSVSLFILATISLW